MQKEKNIIKLKYQMLLTKIMKTLKEKRLRKHK